MRSRGPGFRFHPTDEELIVYYLKRKVVGRKFHCDGIRVLDVYNFAPWDLPGKARRKRDLKWYFFCPRERKYSTGERMNRSTKHGFWKTTGKDRPVHCNEEIVGMIKSLIFHTQNPTQRTNWVMHEYKLWDKYLMQLGLEEDVFVLCVIFEKEGPGPRNGAQYGGAYRDEDWDDDDDCDTDDDEADEELDNCGEATTVVGTLTQVPTDKGKSTVANDFERADGYCVGSSSRTLPSDIDESVNHGFPLSDECGMFVHEFLSSSLENEQAQVCVMTQVPTDKGKSTVANDFEGADGYCVGSSSRTLPSDIGQSVNQGFPLSGEWGMFVHEFLSASLENERAQDIGVDQDITREQGRLLMSDARGCDFLANQNIQPADYLELADCMDVSGPFEGFHDHDHIGPGHPSPSFGPMIPEGVPVSSLVGQHNLSVGISDGMLSWNEHRQEPAERERPINDPQTGLSRFRSSNFPDSVTSELHIPYLDQCPPVFEGSMGFDVLCGSGEYGPFWQHPQFFDGLVGQDFGDNVPYLNQRHHLASGPIWFGDQYFGENVPYLNPHHQFAQGPDAFVGQILRENVSSLYGPQFAEDSVWLGVHGFEENVSHMNQHGQTADGSNGQEASMNGQMDHHFDGVGTAAPFGIMQPPQSMPRGSPHYPS